VAQSAAPRWGEDVTAGAGSDGRQASVPTTQ
jgi:hypothetical protein